MDCLLYFPRACAACGGQKSAVDHMSCVRVLHIGLRWLDCSLWDRGGSVTVSSGAFFCGYRATDGKTLLSVYIFSCILFVCVFIVFYVREKTYDLQMKLTSKFKESLRTSKILQCI